MLLLVGILLLTDMLVLASMFSLAGVLLKFFITSILVGCPERTKWLSGDQFSVGNLTGISSSS